MGEQKKNAICQVKSTVIYYRQREHEKVDFGQKVNGISTLYLDSRKSIQFALLSFAFEIPLVTFFITQWTNAPNYELPKTVAPL